MSGLTLEVVEKAFQLWREQRSSRSESIPKKLWEMVLKIYPKYKRTVICRRLRLSPVKEKLTPHLQLTIQGKERALMLSVDMHAFDKILPSIGMLL
jgi:hypothetical protein